MKAWLAEILSIFPRPMHILGQIDSQITRDGATGSGATGDEATVTA